MDLGFPLSYVPICVLETQNAFRDCGNCLNEYGSIMVHDGLIYGMELLLTFQNRPPFFSFWGCSPWQAVRNGTPKVSSNIFSHHPKVGGDTMDS